MTKTCAERGARLAELEAERARLLPGNRIPLANGLSALRESELLL